LRFLFKAEKGVGGTGLKVSIHDPALFMYSGEHNELKGMFLAHVDDLIHGAGNPEFYNKILNPLKQRFTFGTEDEDDFKYVGMHVKQVGSTIVTDKDSYVANLEVPEIKPGSSMDDLLDEEGQADFRAVAGRIGWIANSSRPDLSYANLVLSMKVRNARWT
jgi:hypothetical protein